MSQLAMLGLLAVVSAALILYALWPKGKVDKDALKRRLMGKRGVDEASEIQTQAKESTAPRMLERVAPIAMKPAPRSMAAVMSALELLGGRTIGVIPTASAAMIMSSAVSSVMVPCSISISTQSKPAWPAISTICGDGIMMEHPKAGSPAVNIALIALRRIF